MFRAGSKQGLQEFDLRPLWDPVNSSARIYPDILICFSISFVFFSFDFSKDR